MPSIEDMAEIARRTGGPDTCFIVMSFSENPILQSYYEEAYLPVIEELGLNAIRVDQEESVIEITDRIKDHLRDSRVVLIDLTEDRPNCYFEAGYAVACETPVVFLRLVAPAYPARFEFDVRDYPHLLYGTLSELRKKLRKRLEAILKEH